MFYVFMFVGYNMLCINCLTFNINELNFVLMHVIRMNFIMFDVSNIDI